MGNVSITGLNCSQLSMDPLFTHYEPAVLIQNSDNSKTMFEFSISQLSIGCVGNWSIDTGYIAAVLKEGLV